MLSSCVCPFVRYSRKYSLEATFDVNASTCCANFILSELCTPMNLNVVKETYAGQEYKKTIWRPSWGWPPELQNGIQPYYFVNTHKMCIKMFGTYVVHIHQRLNTITARCRQTRHVLVVAAKFCRHVITRNERLSRLPYIRASRSRPTLTA